MRRTLVAVAAVALLATGCSGSNDQPADASTNPAASTSPPPASSPSSAEPSSAVPSPAQPAGVSVDITIDGDTVAPNGERIKVAKSEPVTLNISSDRAGELHVHSSPEQEIAFEQGTSTKKVTIDAPGIVDVEDHHSGTVLLQQQVS